jgi:hypothetical protein
MTGRIALVSILMVAGCVSSPPPPEQLAAWEYTRDNRWVEAYEEFQQLKQECSARGGAVLIDRSTSPRMPPSTTEMRLATCSIPR